jgi:hypothetical protein
LLAQAESALAEARGKQGYTVSAPVCLPGPSASSRAAASPSIRFQRFGFYNGTITSVSDTLLRPGESAGAVALKEPSYRVAARLERQTITAYGNEIPLRPDMPLKADIVFDRRSLIEWLFDPLLSVRGRL